MRKMIILSILLVSFLFVGAVSAAPGQDIYVAVNGSDSNSGDLSSPYATIGKAINVSDESKDVTIHLSDGTFSGVGNVNSTISKNHTSGGSLTFIGAGINQTFIDGGNTSWLIKVSSTSTVNLINITFINGKGSTGGAIYNQGISSINNCSFENNTATSSGGAIFSEAYSVSGTLNVSNSYFNKNSATSSGGTICAYSTCNIINSIFTDSVSGSNGGAIYLSGNSNNYSLIKNCTFLDSVATQNGGSLWVQYANVVNNTFENSVTTSTSTSNGGGALYGSYVYLENNSMILCSAASGRGNYIKSGGFLNNTFVTVNNNSITSTSFTVTANVVDDKGNPIDATSSIAFYANSTLLGSGSVIEGVATLNVNELLDNGVYTLIASSNQYSNFTNGTLSVNIDLTPSTYYVSPTGDDDVNDGLTLSTPFKTIQKAIDSGFGSGSVFVNIYLLNGIYSGPGNVNVTLANYLGYLTLAGLNYGQAIIDGNGTNWAINFGYNIQANLENLTIRNCYNTGSNNAIILSTGNRMGTTSASYQKIAIKNCIFEDNVAKTNAFVVRIITGSVENSSFINNAGTSLYLSTGSSMDIPVLVSNSTFSNNYNITNSYGVVTLGNNAVLENSSFINNSVSSGASNASYGIVNFQTLGISRNNQFINNTNSYLNGVILHGNNLSSNDTFDGNNASNMVNSGTFVNDIFRNNILPSGYMAIFYVYMGNLNVTDCTYTNNTGVSSIIAVKSGTVLNNGDLIFESNNSNSLSNVLIAYLDLDGITVSGGSVSFYLNGTLIGSAPLVNNSATINVTGFGNGIYQITGNSANFINAVVQNGVLTIAADEYPSLTLYAGQNGNDTTGDGSINNPYATIQKAIEVGVSKTLNLTVNILPGTLKGTGNVKLTLPDYLNLTITGTKNQSIIDGEATNWIFASSTKYDNILVTFSNLVITNAKALSSTNFGTSAGSWASSGVGIFQINGATLIDNCVFRNNNGTSVSVEPNGKLVIDNSVFTNNSGAKWGTGVYCYQGTSLDIYNSIFSDNKANLSGSDILVYNIPLTRIFNTTFSNAWANSTYAASIAVQTGGNNLTIIGSNFTNNIADIMTCYPMNSAPVPGVAIINSIFNSSGGFVIEDSRYTVAYWTITNCSFINMLKNVTIRGSGPGTIGVSRGTSVLEGNLFKNCTLQVSNIIAENNAMLNSTVYTINSNLNYNYWDGNSPNVYNWTTASPGNWDYWIVPKLVADGKAGLSQVVSLVYTAFDGTDYYDYDVTSIPIPAEEFAYLVENGTVNPVSGNLFNVIYTVNDYGVNTIIANFTNGNSLSLDVNFHVDVTNTNVALSNPVGENGDYVNATISVTGEDGSPVSEGFVEFFLNGSSLGTVELVNGTATKSIQVKGPPNMYEIYAVYQGTEHFGGSNGAELYQLVDTIAPTISLDRAGGSYKSGQNVTLTSNEPAAVIYYTTDGSNPTVSSMVYSEPILVNRSMTLKYFAVDPAGNPSDIYTQSYVIDTVAPVVSKLDPAKNAVVKSANAIKITFNEAIKSGNSWVDIKNSSGTLVRATITVSGNVLTITPNSVLGSGKYTLAFHTGCVADLVGNALALYSSSFTVDSVAPKVSKVDPDNGATKIAAGKTIKVTFNENIKKGSNFWFELKNSSGKAIAFKASVSGKVLTVDPNSNLVESLYTLIIHTGAVTDLAGNPMSLKSSRFSVGTAPTVSKVDPDNGATKVIRTKAIKVTFNENIKAGSNYWVELIDSKGKLVKITKSISGKVLTIGHAKLAANTKYKLVLHTGCVIDKAENPIALKTYTFTTGST